MPSSDLDQIGTCRPAGKFIAGRQRVVRETNPGPATKVGYSVGHTLRDLVAAMEIKPLDCREFVPSMREQDRCQRMAPW
jgi:hypothetical protein